MFSTDIAKNVGKHSALHKKYGQIWSQHSNYMLPVCIVALLLGKITTKLKETSFNNVSIFLQDQNFFQKIIVDDLIETIVVGVVTIVASFDNFGWWRRLWSHQGVNGPQNLRISRSKAMTMFSMKVSLLKNVKTWHISNISTRQYRARIPIITPSKLFMLWLTVPENSQMMPSGILVNKMPYFR